MIVRLIGGITVLLLFTSTIQPVISSENKGTNSVVFEKKDEYRLHLSKNKEDEKYDRFSSVIKKLEDKRAKQLESERAEWLKERKAREFEQRKLNEEKARFSREYELNENRNRQTINAEFTYYTAFCDTGCIGVTASGYDVSSTIYYEGMRIVATDPQVIPMHSILEFEFNGEIVKAIALDTGGAIKGNRIDMLVGSRKEAYALGRNTKEVTILRLGK